MLFRRADAEEIYAWGIGLPGWETGCHICRAAQIYIPQPFHINPTDSLHDLWCALDGGLDERVDTVSLPTFGGNEPQRTLPVWSWDDDQLLVGDDLRDLDLVPRRTVRVWWDEKTSRDPRWAYEVRAYQLRGLGWQSIGGGLLDLAAETRTDKLIEAARELGGPWADVDVVAAPCELVPENPARRQPYIYAKPAAAC